MLEAVMDIERWGDGLGVRIPPAIARAARLRRGAKVTLTLDEDRGVITVGRRNLMTLADRLARYDQKLHCGEVMVAPLAGAEKTWEA